MVSHTQEMKYDYQTLFLKNDDVRYQAAKNVLVSPGRFMWDTRITISVSVHRAPHPRRSRALEVRTVRLCARRLAATAPCKRLLFNGLSYTGQINPVNGYLFPVEFKNTLTENIVKMNEATDHAGTISDGKHGNLMRLH
jgi:hypothetical protein